jgi:hypothetical protein
MRAGNKTIDICIESHKREIFMTAATAVFDVATTDRHYSVPSDAKPDVINGECPKRLRYYAGGVWRESKTDKYMSCYDPSTGAVIAHAPRCTTGEVEEVI